MKLGYSYPSHCSKLWHKPSINTPLVKLLLAQSMIHEVSDYFAENTSFNSVDAYRKNLKKIQNAMFPRFLALRNANGAA